MKGAKILSKYGYRTRHRQVGSPVRRRSQRLLFLPRNLGLHCVRSEATFVRFESPRASINVYHGRRSFEIGLEIESPTDAYSFSEILRLVNQEQGEQYRNYATHTVQGVADGIGKLAKLFQGCIAAGILNDKQLFARLKIQREELARDYALETRLKQARRKAETAWHKKDYAAVVKALEPLRASLTATEVGKLGFAEKQVGNAAD
jgi:hypothetical protein